MLMKELKESDFVILVTDFGRSKDMKPYHQMVSMSRSIKSANTLFSFQPTRCPVVIRGTDNNGKYSMEVDAYQFAAVIFALATGKPFDNYTENLASIFEEFGQRKFLEHLQKDKNICKDIEQQFSKD